MALYKISFLRRIFLPLLQKLSPSEVHIKHHYTGQKFVLHPFINKGYWYHGKNREVDTMNLFKKFIKTGDTVIEVGANIGYIIVLPILRTKIV